MSRFIALLRGINVGGKNKIPMVELRELCREIGWDDVQSYIQSGNVVFSAAGKSDQHESALEHAIEESFGLSVPVVVRTSVQWRRMISGNPFPDESGQEPNRVMIILSKSQPKRNAAVSLRDRAAHGERIEPAVGAVWVHFQQGQAKSKLSPALMDRLIGSTVTMRNWTTALKIQELLDV